MESLSPRMRHTIAWLAMLVIGIAWGTTIPLSKIAVSSGHQPFGLIFWQLVVSIVVLGGTLVWRRWRLRINRELLLYFSVISICGTLVPNGTSYLAQQHLPAGVLAIAIATVPMFTFALALAVRLEKFDAKRMVGILIAFVAMVMIAAPETSLPDPAKAVFVLVALIAPLFYGVEANYLATHKPAGVEPVSTLFMASIVGLVMIIPATFLSGQWIDPMQPWQAPEWALLLASIIHAISYCVFIWLVGFGGPVFSVQTAYPVTLSGVFTSILFLGEGYSGWIWASLLLVIVGIALVQPKIDSMEIPETGEPNA